LNLAIGWIKRAKEIRATCTNHYTHACLLLKIGEKEEAQANALKAIELGKAQGIVDFSKIEKLLKDIKKK